LNAGQPFILAQRMAQIRKRGAKIKRIPATHLSKGLKGKELKERLSAVHFFILKICAFKLFVILNVVKNLKPKAEAFSSKF